MFRLGDAETFFQAGDILSIGIANMGRHVYPEALQLGLEARIVNGGSFQFADLFLQLVITGVSVCWPSCYLVDKGDAYALSVRAVLLTPRAAVGKTKLQSGKKHLFLANAMSCKLEGKLIPPTKLILLCSCREDVPVCLLDPAVILLDSFGQTGRHFDRDLDAC